MKDTLQDRVTNMRVERIDSAFLLRLLMEYYIQEKKNQIYEIERLVKLVKEQRNFINLADFK